MEKDDMKWHREMAFKYAVRLSEMVAVVVMRAENKQIPTEEEREALLESAHNANSALSFWATKFE